MEQVPQKLWDKKHLPDFGLSFFLHIIALFFPCAILKQYINNYGQEMTTLFTCVANT